MGRIWNLKIKTTVGLIRGTRIQNYVYLYGYYTIIIGIQISQNTDYEFLSRISPPT